MLLALVSTAVSFSTEFYSMAAFCTLPPSFLPYCATLTLFDALVNCWLLRRGESASQLLKGSNFKNIVRSPNTARSQRVPRATRLVVSNDDSGGSSSHTVVYSLL